MNLAVVTLGMGTAVYAIIFYNQRFTGGNSGSYVCRAQHLFGINIDPIKESGRYSIVAYVLLILVGWVVCCNPDGRRRAPAHRRTDQ